MSIQTRVGDILGGLQEQERFMELEFRELVKLMRNASQAERIEMASSLALLSEAHLRVQDAIAHLITFITIQS